MFSALFFNSALLQKQFKELTVKNRPLASILSELNFGCLKEFGIPIFVTEIYRSEEDNRKIYDLKTSGTHRAKRTTAHTVWSAVDIRSHDFTPLQQKNIISFLKQYDRWNTWGFMTDSKTVLLHAEGNHGLHFHIQYTGPMPPHVRFSWDENDKMRVDRNSRAA